MIRNFRGFYNADIVLCIDCSGGMKYVLDIFKSNVRKFYDDIGKILSERHSHVHQIRIRVVAFRDYSVNFEDVMQTTEFFMLPDQTSNFEYFIKGLNSYGGDGPKAGLEALCDAIKSKWYNEVPPNVGFVKKRQVILVLTDAVPHPLGFGKNCEHYPGNVASDFDEFSDWWGNSKQSGHIDNKAKRLILYAPDDSYWKVISREWDNIIHFTVKAGGGLEEYEYENFLNAITSTL